jgi:hypothetical protein
MEGWDTGVMLGAAFSAFALVATIPYSMVQAALDTEPQATHEIMTCDNIVHVVEDYKYAPDEYAIFAKQDDGDLVRISTGQWKVDTVIGQAQASSLKTNEFLANSRAGFPCSLGNSIADLVTPDETIFNETIGRLLPKM